jgi:hypothetical protein
VRHSVSRWTLCIAMVGAVLGTELQAQEDAASALRSERFQLQIELKSNFRDTADLATVSPFPFPPSFIPPGQTQVFLKPPAAGSSFELQTVNLIGQAHLEPGITSKVEVHFLDLYNRNPTSSDERVQIHDAWVRFGGRTDGPVTQPDGPTLYAQFGRNPLFIKERQRRLESYGLWSTAIARFEENGLEVGGDFGKHLYWRSQAASANPLFFRDPNALAGDNGTPERQPGDVHPIYQSGFPILYDAKSTDLNVSGKLHTGVGFGWRAGDKETGGVDVLGWYFERTLADFVAIHGSTYSGDLGLLNGPFPDLFHAGLPIHGDRKQEGGINVDARVGGLIVFAQGVAQDIAGLKRSGAEGEFAYRLDLPGILFGETPVLRWIQPAIRVSFINNHFTLNPIYPAPSVGWNWRKYDIGARLGVVPGIDLTAEYARNVVFTQSNGIIHPDEFLFTVRTAY